MTSWDALLLNAHSAGYRDKAKIGRAIDVLVYIVKSYVYRKIVLVSIHYYRDHGDSSTPGGSFVGSLLTRGLPKPPAASLSASRSKYAPSLLSAQ